MENAINNSKRLTDSQKKSMQDRLSGYYEKSKRKYGDGDGLTTGTIEKMFGKPGGGEQYDMPFGMDVLQDIGMIQKV